MTAGGVPTPGAGGSRFGVRLRGWYLLPLVLVALAAHVALTGVWVVQQNEQGVVLRFGRVRSVLPGGHALHPAVPAGDHAPGAHDRGAHHVGGLQRPR